MASASQEVREFRRLLVSIAHQLSAEDSHELAFVDELPVQFHDQQALTVLQRLEAEGLFSCSKPERLVEMLKDIKRVDLSKKVKEFVSKKSKRRKNRPENAAADATVESDSEVSLRAGFEVALIQMQIVLEQLERVQEEILEEQQMRVQEVLLEAKDYADKMQKKLQHAAALSREGFARKLDGQGRRLSATVNAPKDESESRIKDESKDLTLTRSKRPTHGISCRTPQPPVPPPKPQRPLSATATTEEATDEEEEDIYDEPCTSVPPAKPVTNSHYYSVADVNPSESRLTNQPLILPAPIPYHSDRVRTATTSRVPRSRSQMVTGRSTSEKTPPVQHKPPPPTANRVKQQEPRRPEDQLSQQQLQSLPDSHVRRQPSLPSQRPGAPKPKPKRRSTAASFTTRHRGVAERCHEETDTSDYSGGTGTDDSGFSDPRAFLKQLPPQSRRSLPSAHRLHGSSGSNYYKSLQRPDGVSDYYKALNRDTIPEATYTNMKPQEPEKTEPLYVNLSEARNTVRGRQ